MNLHRVSQELGKCQDPATQNTQLCGLVGAYFEGGQDGGDGSTNATDAQDPTQTDQLMLIGNPVSTVQPWQSYLVQGVMTQASPPSCH